jgi:hypothetical protein
MIAILATLFVTALAERTGSKLQANLRSLGNMAAVTDQANAVLITLKPKPSSGRKRLARLPLTSPSGETFTVFTSERYNHELRLQRLS